MSKPIGLNIEPDDSVVPMGYIAGAFGIQGWVKIKTSTEKPDSLSKFKQLLLLINGSWCPTKVEKHSSLKDIFQAKLENISDRDQAMALRGTTVGVLRSQLPKPDKNEYYWIDLIGLNVINQQQEVFGTVTSLMETGANSVLVVKGSEQEYLIPFVKAYVLDVDFTNKQIIVDWGLDY